MSEASNPSLRDQFDHLDHALSRIRGSISCMEILAVNELSLHEASPGVAAFYSTLSALEAFAADAQKAVDEMSRIRMDKANA
jgi:hypothetical protein